MDFASLLKGEINRKKRTIDAVRHGKEYVRASELEEAEENTKRRKVKEGRTEKLKTRAGKDVEETDKVESGKAEQSLTIATKPAPPPTVSYFGPIQSKTKDSLLVDAEIGLRKAGEPTRRYGEKDSDVIKRWQGLGEPQAASAASKGVADNVATSPDTTEESSPPLQHLKEEIQQPEQAGLPPVPQSSARLAVSAAIDKTLVASDLPLALLQCRAVLRALLQKWEGQHPDPALLIETKRWLVPLLVALKRNTLEPGMAVTLCAVVYDLQIKDFQQAEQDYLKLSVGNVAWPIGVAQVSIHSRSADAKLENQAVSNIMKDDKTRHWILSVKRLITATKGMV